MINMMVFGKKGKKTRGSKDDNEAPNVLTGELDKQVEDYLKQARATLLEANISGAEVRDAQEIFKTALREQKGGHYEKALEHAMECIELVDTIMKNT